MFEFSYPWCQPSQNDSCHQLCSSSLIFFLALQLWCSYRFGCFMTHIESEIRKHKEPLGCETTVWYIAVWYKYISELKLHLFDRRGRLCAGEDCRLFFLHCWKGRCSSGTVLLPGWLFFSVGVLYVWCGFFSCLSPFPSYSPITLFAVLSITGQPAEAVLGIAQGLSSASSFWPSAMSVRSIFPCLVLSHHTPPREWNENLITRDFITISFVFEVCFEEPMHIYK